MVRYPYSLLHPGHLHSLVPLASLVDESHHLVLPERFFLFEASVVSIFYLVNNDQLHITVAMLPLTKMFSHLTNAVPELAAMAVMALTHLSPASTNVLFSTVRDLTLDQVDNPGTATV